MAHRLQTTYHIDLYIAYRLQTPHTVWALSVLCFWCLSIITAALLCTSTSSNSNWFTVHLTISKCVKRAVGILTAVRRKILTDTFVLVVEEEICGC